MSRIMHAAPRRLSLGVAAAALLCSALAPHLVESPACSSPSLALRTTANALLASRGRIAGLGGLRWPKITPHNTSSLFLTALAASSLQHSYLHHLNFTITHASGGDWRGQHACTTRGFEIPSRCFSGSSRSTHAHT